MNIIEAENLSFRYRQPIFTGANFSIARNSVTGIIGSNGAGKTTLFDLLCRIKKPTTGKLDIHTSHPAYLSQTVSTSPALRLGDLFTMISALGLEKPINMVSAAATLSQWNISLAQRFQALSYRRPAQCSYGEIRYYFALALLVSPNDLVLLDEPTAGVDPEHRYYIWQAILSAKKEGKTVIVSSHNLQEIAQHTDIFWFINNQEVVPFQSAETFLARYGGNNMDEAFIRATSLA